MDFLEEASTELSAAAAWYEDRSAGLGQRFIDDVEQVVELLEQHPEMGAPWSVAEIPADVEVRRFPLRRFPYLVVYVVVPSPTIIAVAHGRRLPRYWSDRL